MSSVFVNLELRNDTASSIHVDLSETRDPVVLKHPQNYELAIDRFSLHKAWLPIMEDEHDLKVKIIKKSDSSTSTDTLDFSGLVDTNGLMYDTAYFVGALNASITSVCAGVGIASGFPTVALEPGSWIATLDYSGVASFAADYYLQFNEALYGIFSTLPYSDVLGDQAFYSLALTDASPFTIETTEPINLSPVDKIYIKSNNIPLIYEFSPATTVGSASNNSEAIVTDFNFNGSNRNPLNNINYEATTGQYRFHGLQPSTNFNNLDLKFFFKTYNNNSHPLYILASGSCNVKLYFRKLKDNAEE